MFSKNSPIRAINSKTKFILSVLIPAMLFLGVFSFFPIIFTMYTSLNKWDFYKPMKFVGFENFIKIFNDPLFHRSLLNTTVYTLGMLVLGVTISIILALGLSKLKKGLTVYRAAFFLPVVMPMIPASLMWVYIYHPLVGMANQILNFLSLPSQPWLGSPRTALFSLIIMSVWKTMGTNIIILLAGILQIPEIYLEAAKVDGASPWTCFTRITMPLLKPILAFVIITTMINGFQVFDQIYVMTSATSYQPGGPSHSTYVLSLGIYLDSFKNLRVGIASAEAMVLFLIVIFFSVFIFRYYGVRVGTDRGLRKRK